MTPDIHIGEISSFRLEGALNLSVLRKTSPYSLLAWLAKSGWYFCVQNFWFYMTTKFQNYKPLAFTCASFFPYNPWMPDLRLLQLSLYIPVSPGNHSLPLLPGLSHRHKASLLPQLRSLPGFLLHLWWLLRDGSLCYCVQGGHWFHPGSLQRYQIFQSENKLAHSC